MPHVDLPQAEFKVVLLGDTFTGKTSLVLRFAEGYYRESARSATVGAFFITKRLTVPSVGLTCKIQIWDTAGQEQFKPLAPMYYSNSAAAILCYDPASPKSLETLKYWLDQLHQNVPAGRIVIAMAACKCDLLKNGGANNSQAVQSLQEVEELAANMGAIFVATSAKNNENVTELFRQVAERVLQFQKNNKITGGSFPVTLGSTSPKNSSPRHASNSSSPVGLVPRPDSTLNHQQRAKSTGALSPIHSMGSAENSSHPVSPHSVGYSGNREDYLHRRSHHVESSNNAPSSPSHSRLTDPNKMNESPILANGGGPSSPDGSDQGTPTPSAPPKLSAVSATMCGDAEYLNCATYQFAEVPANINRCVIL